MGYGSTKSNQYLESFRLFLKIRNTDDSRLTYKVHMWSMNIGRSWDKKCVEIANNLDFMNIIDGPFSIQHKLKVIKEFMFNNDKTEWFNNLYDDRNEPNGNKLRTFRMYKNNLETDFYVKNVFNRQHRRILSNFRSGCLPLAIETGRYTKPKVPLNQRTCTYCKNNCIEDEMHFLLSCNFYSDLRFLLSEKAYQIFNEYYDMDLRDRFIFLMTNETIQPFLAKILYRMFYRRKYCIL